MTVQSPIVNIKDTSVKIWRVKPSIKIAVMALSILALSLFFEGWREVKTALTAGSFAILVSGILTTVFLLWIQAFWIYIEEKQKGTLKKKIIHFDKLQSYIEKRKDQYRK